MKLWQKDKASLQEVDRFTVGKDREMDMFLARFDILGSLAHITMLESIGLLTKPELEVLSGTLKELHAQVLSGNFEVESGVEDIHSQVELMLTRKLGDVGKKIHAGRSRNDQVLVDIKLFLRSALHDTVNEVKLLFDLLQSLAEKHQHELVPGYTHLQLAMPSSFGLWFGAYAESLVDDLATLLGAYKVVNRNPLGSAAGYGSSFPLNRTMTTRLLGFSSLNYNVVYAQMGRGKTERIVASALSNVAATVGKLAMDACLFLNQNFGFISFPTELTTGSSIMPHKKNPDVFELVRGRCSQLQALPNDIALGIANLPSGYHREMQLLKELLFPAFEHLRDCLQMTRLMLANIEIKKNILDDDKYKFLFSVEEVNKLVLDGVPFRDAYRKVGMDIEEGNYQPSRSVNHTHEGSIGNLCLPEVNALMDRSLADFHFEEAETALALLVK
ncbi:argininosuccinate lyase [Chryseolinea sp. T2]|uniref:argininosuccinate lyase n=1 Tax=Chryseolinea sp. T2 TaxID=3129255 RepID=UPI003077580C